MLCLALLYLHPIVILVPFRHDFVRNVLLFHDWYSTGRVRSGQFLPRKTSILGVLCRGLGFMGAVPICNHEPSEHHPTATPSTKKWTERK